MSRLRDALDAIAFARTYTRGLLDAVDPADWFRVPAGGVVTHVGWQVGHLAMSQYRLGFERVIGPRPGDEELFPPDVLKLFIRQSVVLADPAAYPSPAELRALFDRVHDRLLADLADWPDADLDAPPAQPSHHLCPTKLHCLRWCAAHEMIHAGQIGLLRRLFGHPPVW